MFQDDSEESGKSDSDEELHDNTGIKEQNNAPSSKVSDGSDDDDSHFIADTPPKKKTAPAKDHHQVL